MLSQRLMLFSLFVLLSAIVGSIGAETKRVASPPTIYKQSEKEVAYIPKEKVELKCLASGFPEPLYTWWKNGQPLIMTGLEIQQLPTEGTLVINDPKSSHEGVYQCFASNAHGTAVSLKTLLKRAVLEPFPTIKEPPLHRPLVGQPLILNCQPPYSYPSASVYWGDNRNSSKLRPIDNSARVSQDYAGNLYFANVDLEDENSGRAYICLVYNNELRSLVQGDDQRIEPRPIVGMKNDLQLLGGASKLL